MKANKWFIKMGYMVALLCFLLQLVIIITNLVNDDRIVTPIFLGLGGVLLLITSIFKFAIDRRQ